MASSQSCILNESGDINSAPNVSLTDYINRDPYFFKTSFNNHSTKSMNLLVFQNFDSIISKSSDDILKNLKFKGLSSKYKSTKLESKNEGKAFLPLENTSTGVIEECFRKSLNLDDNSNRLISPSDFKSAITSEELFNNIYNVFDEQLHIGDQVLKYKTSSQDSSESSIVDNIYHVWSGNLKQKTSFNPTYSNKVFLGGVPWDITEQTLLMTFRNFGPCRIEWPGKDGKNARHPPKGYVYLLFDNERSVKSLLNQCCNQFENYDDGRSQQNNHNEYYFPIISRRLKSKEIQVIPWIIGDSNYLKNSYSQRLDPLKTVFVGGLHGMITAESLASIMDEIFGGVIYAGIDTDKYKYPIGSGRITFDSCNSYMKAVQAAYIEIKTTKFTKKIQIDPYLEDSICGSCSINPGPFFCRDPVCYKYFCRSCWLWHHSVETLQSHKPISRHSKSFNGPNGTNSDAVFTTSRPCFFGQNTF